MRFCNILCVYRRHALCTLLELVCLSSLAFLSFSSREENLKSAAEESTTDVSFLTRLRERTGAAGGGLRYISADSRYENEVAEGRGSSSIPSD